MFNLIKKTQLSNNQFDYVIEAPRIAKKAKPGQFVILRIDEFGERIPLTIADSDSENGTIRIIFQVIGKTTKELSELKENETIKDILGPLGMPTELKKYGTVLLVGGGVGIAALYPIIKGLKKAGNRVVTILGAKTKNLVILKDECSQYSDELIIMTDDGSLGGKGLVTSAMEKVFEREIVNQAWAIGPSMMMKFSTLTANKYDVPIYVSLNPIMVDGTGMCGGCRVTIAGSMKFACVDGPEFLGNEVDWDEFIQRLSEYSTEEKTACHLNESEGQING